MTKQKRRRSKLELKKLPPEERVVAILEDNMGEFGYPELLLRTAVRMWELYYKEHMPRIRSAGGHAASIEYLLIHMHVSGLHVTQQELSERYETTTATISRLSNLMYDFFAELPGDAYLPTYEEEYEDDDGDEMDPDVLSMLSGMAHLLDPEDATPEVFQELLPPGLMDALRQLPKTQETWVGGRRTLDVYMRDPDLHHPDVVLWAEGSGHPVLGQMILPPGLPDPVAVMSLTQAMMEPDMGPPRLPRLVLVANQELVEPLQVCFGELGIAFQFGGVKVLEAIVTLLESHLKAPDESAPEPNYTYSGDIPDDTVGEFFEEMAVLYEQAPWKFLHDSHVFGIDLYRDGYERVAVIVIGGAGQAFGLLVFENIDAFYMMNEASQFFDGVDPSQFQPPPIDVMSIEFERGADLPAPKRQECMTKGWNVVSSQAYPNLEMRERLLMLRPLVTRDYEVATLIVKAMTTFFRKHKANLKKPNPKPCSLELPPPKGSFDLPVTVSYPHPDYNGR